MGWRPGRAAWGWAFYDWANSTFSTTVMAGFFPVFFKQYWSAGSPATESTFHLGNANALASLMVVVLAPVVGAVADALGRRKAMLLVFTLLGVVMTGALSLVQQGHWLLAAALYVAAVVGYSGGNLFYDALLVFVAPREDLDRASAMGYALGYLGGGLLFALNVTMTLKPAWFGLADAAAAVRLSFVMVAVWWLVFTVPALVLVKESAGTAGTGALRAVAGGLRRLAATVRQVAHLRQAFLFLAAYWLYIDGVDTIIRMAVDYGLSLGFPASSLIVALLITQFVGFPAALVYGHFGARLGARRAIVAGLLVYIGVTVFSVGMTKVWEFYLLAGIIGLVQGGVQSLSRSVYARLIPHDRSGEFFGFYNMLGKFAAVLGPALIGWTALLTGNPREAILSVVVLFVAGVLLLVRVDMARGHRDAAAASSV